MGVGGGGGGWMSGEGRTGGGVAWGGGEGLQITTGGLPHNIRLHNPQSIRLSYPGVIYRHVTCAG